MHEDRSKAKRLYCCGFLQHLYNNHAEDFAEAFQLDGINPDDMDDHAWSKLVENQIDKQSELFLSIMGCGPTSEISRVDIKLLPPMTYKEVYELFEAWDETNRIRRVEAPAQRPVLATLLRAWQEFYSHKLKMRNKLKHSPCEFCEEKREERKIATSKIEKKSIAKLLAEHRREQMLDRLTYKMIRMEAQQYACSGKVPSETEEELTFGEFDPNATIMSMIVDGMDQAKFKCPRKRGTQALWKGLWKPQLHMSAVIVHGIGDFYFVGDENIAKNSNSVIQQLSESLEAAERIYAERGLALPRHIALQADNCIRENKNQWIFAWAASLVSCGKFQSVSVNFLRKGHTHNDVDQRPSSLSERYVAHLALASFLIPSPRVL